MNDTTDQVVRDTATVTVKDAVDGTKKRRKPAEKRAKAVTTHQIRVDDRVWKVAQTLVTDQTKVKIVSATEVLVVNR